MHMDWEIENLAVHHAQTPQAISREICTIYARNTNVIFHHNPLEVYISQESASTAYKIVKQQLQVIIVNKNLPV